MYRPGRRRLPIFLVAAALAVIVVLVAWYSAQRMERGATSHLDEGDDRHRPMPSPVSAPSPSTEADDPVAGDDDGAPGTSDDHADEARLDEPRGQETPGETARDTGSVTGADDEWKEEIDERQ